MCRRLSCPVIIFALDHSPRARPCVPVNSKRPESLPPAFCSSCLDNLAFDEPSLEHLVIAQPQVRNVR